MTTKNSNLGGVKFGIDGEGNRCYLGADGSLIPFGNKYPDLTQGYILPLTNNKYDMKTIDPENYKKYTSENFKAVVTSLGAYNISVNSDGGIHNIYSVNVNPTCSYDASTGIVSVDSGSNGSHTTITYNGDTRLNNSYRAENTAMLLFIP